MWKLLWLLFFATSLSGQEASTVIPANFDHEEDIDSEELSDIARAIYMVDDTPEIFNAVYPKVRTQLRDVNHMPAQIHLGIKVDLEKLHKSPHHRHSYHTYHHHYPNLHGYITKVINRCMREALHETQQNVLEIERDKHCYKVAAVTFGFIGTVLTAGTALAVHFTQGSCDKS